MAICGYDILVQHSRLVIICASTVITSHVFHWFFPLCLNIIILFFLFLLSSFHYRFIVSVVIYFAWVNFCNLAPNGHKRDVFSGDGVTMQGLRMPEVVRGKYHCYFSISVLSLRLLW